MNNHHLSPRLQEVAKKEKQPKWRTGNIIVNYTRVSDTSQFDNTSLETQKKDSIVFADKRGYEIKCFFGGVVESAKTDERKEFKKMLDYVKKDKTISAILVYSYERFSRSEYAADLSRELGRMGVKVLSVIQEVDVTSAAGKLQQNIFYAFGNYDNELRKEKTVRGMVENLLNGYWVAATPFGYTNLRRKEKAKYHQYVINEQGEYLKLGFKWKAEGKLSNKEIIEKMHKTGSKIEYKSFVRIISNPFYCGYVTHSLIPGKVIKGHHPPLVSEELFMQANDIVTGNPHKGIAKKYKREELPLKSFLKSELNDLPFTGYIKKGIYYYKTRGKGGSVNERADVVNGLFTKELSKYVIQEKHKLKIEKRVTDIVSAKFEDQLKEQEAKKKKITELKNKIEQLELRFIEREITKELFDKYMDKYAQENKELEREIANSDFKSSNLEKIIKKGIAILLKPLLLWEQSDYNDKQRLQYLLFPDGIRYNKEKREVRTPRVNTIISAIACTAKLVENENKKATTKSGLHSCGVVSSGIEPESRASETLILSIVLRDQYCRKSNCKLFALQN